MNPTDPYEAATDAGVASTTQQMLSDYASLTYPSVSTWLEVRDATMDRTDAMTETSVQWPVLLATGRTATAARDGLK